MEGEQKLALFISNQEGWSHAIGAFEEFAAECFQKLHPELKDEEWYEDQEWQPEWNRVRKAILRLFE